MDSSLAQQLASQLAFAVPTLLVCLAAAVLAACFWSRCPRASVLVLLAVLVLGAVALAAPFAQTYLLERRLDGSMDPGAVSRSQAAIAVVATSARTVGLGLLVAAVFVGRGRRASATPA